MLNPTHLRTLSEVLTAGSFAGAAARLGYTASAVSQQMAALERVSGVTLFDRQGRSIRPTHAARAIADHATRILRSLDALEREVSALACAEGGLVRIGSFPTASASILPGALARLRRARPNVSVRLHEGEPDELVPVLDAGGVDLALVYEYEWVPRTWPRGLTAVPLMAEGLCLLAPADCPSLPDAPSLRDLRDASWIATLEGTGGERCLVQLCANAGFQPRVDYRSNDFGVVRELVRAGVGFAIVPALAVVEDHGLRALPLPDRAPKRNVLALSRTDGSAGLVDAVLRVVVEAAQVVARGPLVTMRLRRAQVSGPTPDSPALEACADGNRAVLPTLGEPLDFRTRGEVD